MDPLYSNHGLDLLFKKLGHDLVEIRTRALSSIVSKLEHGLLHEADLVQERQLLIRLLEWFNFRPAPMQEEVFGLLLGLAKHSSACELLVSLGAGKFLSDLRPDLEPSMKPCLDSLLDRLFHVTDGTLNDSSRCVYQKERESLDATAGDISSENKPSPHLASGYFRPMDNEINSNYRMNAVQNQEKPAMSPGDEDITSFIRFPGFPWHSLTATDRHVLASTSSSLCSSNTHLVRKACSFLLDVVFRDFPAEIFLQRPTIINTLLTLLGSRPGSNLMTSTSECMSFVAKNLLSRIRYYQDPEMYCPRQGLSFHRRFIPRFYQDDVRSASSRLGSRMEAEGERQERAGGDGRDESSATSSTESTFSSGLNSIHHARNQDLLFRNEDDSLEEEQTAALQLSQISTQQFCISSLQTIVPLLRIDSPQMFLSFYQVSSECIGLLHHVLDPEQLWICNNQTAQTLQREVSCILEALGEAVLYHYHLNSSENMYQRSPRGETFRLSDADEWSLKFDSKHDATYHRVAYHACSILTIKFLTSMIPVEKSSCQIKSRLSNALYVITCDVALGITFANVCETAEAYLEQCNKEKYEIVCRLRKVLRSIRHTHEFLDEITLKDRDMDAVLESAESSLICLPYYSVKDQIYLIISIVSEACNEKFSAFQASRLHLSRNVLLKLLSHAITRIRSSAYEACLKIAKSSLNVTTAAEDPNSVKSHCCNFLIDSSMLYEICLHGIGDSSVLVSSPAQDLLLVMLQSKLLMDEDLWMKFREVLQPVMPVLQAYTGETELLRSAVFDLFSPSDFSYLEIIQSLLRALLIKQRSVRSFAAGLFGKILARYKKELRQNDDSLGFLLTRASNVVGLTDLLMVENPLSLASFDSAARSANSGLFHEDAVVRMLGIFRSRSVEWSVRRSSLQQLAVMLNDPKLHDIFLKSDGLLTIKLHLIELVQDSSVLTEPEKLEADVCVSLMKSIARLSPGIRQDLYSDVKVLLSLLRTSDLCRLSSSSLCQASATLALLLFHDVLQDHKPNEDPKLNKEISLPAAVVSRYQIPFLCPSHHVISIHRTQTTPPTQYNPLVVGPSAFAISVTSSVVKHSNNVIDTLNSNNEGAADKRSNAVAKMMETVAMTYSYPISAVTEIVDSLSNATSHPGVRHFVTLLRILLISNPDQFSTTMFAGDSWQASLNKFLEVLPSSVEDESLLLDIVHLLDDLMDAQSSSELYLKSKGDDIVDTLTWLLDICIPTEDQHLTTHKPLFSILESSEPQREPFPPSTSGLSSVTIRRCLCKAILSLLSHVSRRLSFISQREGLVHRFQAFLCQVLLIRLKLADAPQFYDLPSMEVTLECLKHVTASGPGWLKVNVLDWESRYAGPVPTDGTILCRQLTVTLLEVVSAFDIESRNSSMSYMGKGVSRSATQSILHLVNEMARCTKGKKDKQDWLSLLHHVTSLGNTKSLQVKHSDAGYKWMLPLWSARDPRIRLSGVSLAVTISRTVPGCIALSYSFENYFGGLWSMCFEVYFDESECSAVRSQAAHLLSNLISHEFQTPSERGDENIWQGPVVRDEENDATLTGIPALVALLRHLKFHQHVVWLITRYHRNPIIQPILILYTPFISSTSYSTSTPGGDSLLSPGGFGTTPVTQQSLSNSENDTLHSRSMSSPNAQNVSTSTSRDSNMPLGLMSNHTSLIRPNRESLGSLSSSLPPEWQAVYTPTLISNTCTLLCNTICLMPHEMIELFEQNGAVRQIGHLVDASYLQDLLKQLKQYTNVHTDQQTYCDETASVEATALSLICQYSETCRMLHAYSSHDRNVAFSLLKDHELFGKVASLLSLPSPYENWDSKLLTLKQNAMNFISVSTQLNIKRAAEDIKHVLSQEWMSFSRSVLNLLSVDRIHVLTSTLVMLSSLLSCLGIQLKMNQSEASFCSLFDHSTGEDFASELCANLIHIFGVFVPKSNLEENFQVVSICCTTLQVLFTTSITSKETAIKTGFVEQILEELKQLLSKLELFSTSILAAKGKTKAKNQIRPAKECEHIIKMVQVLLTLLNNFLHDSSYAKTIACGAGFGQILAKLWGWTPLYPKLQASVLRASSAYTANCECACSSLAVNTVSQPSFTFNIVTLARDIVSKVTLRTGVQASHQQLVYSLLCNLTASHECRAIVWKSSLLNEFQTVADKGQHPKRSKQQITLLMHWLKLLYCLSFHTDGQLNILRVHDILEILLEIRETNNQNSDMVMKIIRNLCFHSPSKQRISSNKAVLRHFKQGLSTGRTGSSQLSTSSALWSLLTNNQKAKVHLKGAGLTGHVQSMIALLNQQEGFEEHEELLTSLSAVLDIMQQ